MSRDEWTVDRHSAGGLHVTGADEDGQRVSFRISRLDALDLSAALENTALRPAGLLRDDDVREALLNPTDEQVEQGAKALAARMELWPEQWVDDEWSALTPADRADWITLTREAWAAAAEGDSCTCVGDICLGVPGGSDESEAICQACMALDPESDCLAAAAGGDDE